MGYMKHKYTRVYFLKKDADGNPTPYGAEGVEAFEKGGIRLIDEDILRRLEFLGKVVLDFGFGRGEAIKYALDKGATKAVGVDFSEAANAIAADFLRDYGTRVELYCEDALEFLKLYVLSRASEHFDIVLMLDFIEHVPRSELAELLKLLRSAMSQRGIVIINTPVFTVDNDVIKEGLKAKARDTSDHFEETAGMHCNRYTRQSLQRFLQRCGYQAISGHVFVSKTPKPLPQRGNPGPWRKALIQGYPVKAFAPDEPEVFEYVSPSDALPYYIKVLKKLRLLSTLSSAKELVVGLIGHLANVMNSGLIFRQGMGKDRNRSDEP
ncbi:MAG: class I SAM-dependent methyltransferase, partial [Dehalococcoidales bacterium]|nr:class I SAM-dependent methyltransferase [Dehalococcoidales bacterium]